MGLLGGILLLGGIGSIILGIVGVAVNLYMWQLPEARYSGLMILGGFAAGGLAAAILE